MTTRRNPMLECRFYRTPGGSEPAREWLKGLPLEVKKTVGADISLAQWTWPVGKPLVGSLGAGLYEIRTSVDGNIYRVLFCLDGAMLVLLHGFQKKTQKTPQADLDLARRRMKS